MPADSVHLSPADLIDIAKRRRAWLIAPAVVGFVLALVGSFLLPRPWLAEQGFLIRSDAAGYADQRLGKFTDLAEMKTVQETLLELVRSRSVVTHVLTDTTGQEPSAQDIADFRDNLRFSPPGGAEFGKTEVFYLGVLDPNRSLAVRLVEATARELNTRLQQLRDERAGSMVSEVERSVDVARAQLAKQLDALATFERSIGADLIELRHLTSPNGGQSEFSQRSLAIEADLRASIARSRNNEALLVELQAATQDASRLVATPDTLLASQPGLRRLKDGLVDAQLSVARIGGARTDDHPFVLAARQAETQVRRELERELPTALAGVKLELEVAARREAELVAQLDTMRRRSGELAGQRARYAELAAGVESQTRVLEGALKQLADARAHRAGASSASLLAAIDAVETGANPTGPSRKAVCGAGGLAGLLLGMALVFVLEAPGVPTLSGAAPPAAAMSSAPRQTTPAPQPPTTRVATPAAGEFGAPGVRAVATPAPATPAAAATPATPASDESAEDWLASFRPAAAHEAAGTTGA
ncbi:MAG: hypothetical protein AAFV43_12210 [Planctomycetota bacterium]